MTRPFSVWPVFFGDLLAECGHVAAALLLVMILTILIGRRSHADLVRYGVACLRRLALGLAVPGLAGFILPIILILGHWPETVTMASLFHPVVLPWTMASLFWLFAFVWIFLVRRIAIWSCMIPLFIALAAGIVCNWPFAGLPQGMDSATVFAVLALQTGHRLFLGLSLAGGIALFFVPHWQRTCQFGAVSLGEGNRKGAMRWLAFWACLGAVPFLVDRWGLVIGNLMHQSASSVVASLLARMVPLSIAVFCWAVLLALPVNQDAGRETGGKRSDSTSHGGGIGPGTKSGFARGFLRMTRLAPEHLAWIGLVLALAGIILQALIQHGIFAFDH